MSTNDETGQESQAAEPVKPGRYERRRLAREEARRRRSDPDGNLRADLWRAGIKHAQQMPTAEEALASARLAPTAAAVPATGTWAQIGPAPVVVDGVKQFMGAGPVAGQVTGVAIDPSGSQDDTIYVTSNDGGVWKSIDGGTTWTPKSDNTDSLSMGMITLDPSHAQTVFAGTGNLYGNQFFKGVGILKSTNGGDTWTLVNPGSLFTPAAGALGIRKIVMPATNVLLVATNAGLFRSIDGGAHFGANAPSFNDGNPISIGGTANGDVTDLAVDTVTRTTVYAGVAGQGLFKSTNSGAEFKATDKLWPAAPPVGGLGNVIFAQSGSGDNGQTMFISATQDSGVGATQYLGLFKSTNTGASWSPVAGTNAAAKATEAGLPTQVGYDHLLAVDPHSPARVYLCFQEVYVSTDSGVNFGKPPAAGDNPPMTGNAHRQAHWDTHVIVFSPHGTSSPTRVYIGNDGGLVRSDDGGTTWVNLNSGVATCLFLGIDIGRGNALNNVWTYGGTQDNGTIEHRVDSSGLEWHLMFNGDGGKVAVDPTDPTKAYGSSNGRFLITTNGGLAWTDRFVSASNPIPDRVTCVAIDPNSTARIFFGLDAAAGPPAVSPQLCFSSSIATNFSVLATFTAAITSIAVAPTNSNTIYLSLADGTVQKSTNGGTSFSPTTATGAPGTMSAEQVAVDPTDANRVAVVYSGLSGNNPASLRTQHVFLSTSGGTSWIDASGTDGGPANQNLPDIPLMAVVFDPDTSPNHALVVAGDGGVMQSLDNGASWHRLGTGLPNAECRSLALDHTATPSLLRVGTFGRSVFQLVATPPPTTPPVTTPPVTTPPVTTPPVTTPPVTTPPVTTPPVTTPPVTTPPVTTPPVTTPPVTTPPVTTPPVTTPPVTTPPVTTPPPTTPPVTTPPVTTPPVTTPPVTTPPATTPPPTTPPATTPPATTPPPTTPPATTPPATTPPATTPPPTTPPVTTPPPTTPPPTTPPETTPPATTPPATTPPATTPPPTTPPETTPPPTTPPETTPPPTTPPADTTPPPTTPPPTTPPPRPV